jgi:uncharacterized membrane protein YgcG
MNKMTEKQKQRVRNYQNSEGLARIYYHIVIALTMGNVESAVEQYEREQESDIPVVNQFAREEQADEKYTQNKNFGVVYGGRRSGKSSNQRRGAEAGRYQPTPHYKRGDDDDDSTLSDALLGAAIYEILSGESVDTSSNNDTAGFSGFGGGGDFGGGGAGGSWDTNNDSY